MSEEVSMKERVGWKESRGFIAKMAFAQEIFPLVFGTLHERIIVDCFERPTLSREEKFEEHPTSYKELQNELEGRKTSCERRIELMNDERKRRGLGRVVKDEAREGRKKAALDEVQSLIQEGLLQRDTAVAIKHKMSQIEELQAWMDPSKLGEVERDLEEINGAIVFLRGQIDKEK